MTIVRQVSWKSQEWFLRWFLRWFWRQFFRGGIQVVSGVISKGDFLIKKSWDIWVIFCISEKF